MDVPDKWTDPETQQEFHNDYTPVWRWRRANFDDFKCAGSELHLVLEIMDDNDIGSLYDYRRIVLTVTE